MTWRGGEQVLQTLASLFPNADIFTLVADPRCLPETLRNRPIYTSWLQRIPGRRYFRWGLPLFPWTVEQFQLSAYDVVISISHAIAKGVRPNGMPHLNYCLTPMRYAWIYPELYLGSGALKRWTPQYALMRYLRDWDARNTDRVDYLVAISQTVRARIQQCYHRDADVIYPPVECDRFTGVPRTSAEYYLVVAALVPYKRTELAIAACNRLRKPLVIIGTGPEQFKLRRLAGPTVKFIGYESIERLARWYAGARALLYPQIEDFGIAAVEAQAAGCPVIAYRQGGATETVIDGVTGLFFEQQSVDALAEAIFQFERQQAMDPEAIRRHARRFDRHRFETQFLSLLSTLMRQTH